MMGHVAMGLLDLFSSADVANAPIQHHVMILMVLKTVEVLEIVEGTMLMDPCSDGDARINLAIEMLEALESWSNLMGDHPLEMMCCSDLWNCSEMEMRMVDQSPFGILCSFMKPDQSATTFWFRKLPEVAMVDGAQELVPEVSGVIRSVDECIGCWRPLNRDEPGWRILVPLVL